MEIREVKIEEYWPLIVKNTEEFGQIAVAENPEFNKLAGCIYQVLQDSFVRDATEYSVGRWENMLDLTPENGDTLDDRKARILTCLNIKLPYTVRVLRQMLIGLLGEDNFTMNINNDTATLTVAVSLDTTESQIAEVESLLDHVLPRNLVTEMEWEDGLPIDYEHVDYLETVTQNHGQYIATGLTPTSETSCKIRIMLLTPAVKNNTSAYAVRPHGGPAFNLMAWNDSGYFPILYWGTQESQWYDVNPAQAPNKWVVFENRKNELWLNGVLRKALNPETFVCSNPMYLFVNNHIGSYPIGRSLQRCSGFEAWEGDVKIANYIPAVNKNTGTPGFFDTVNKVFKTNAGTGDFTYPGAEQAIQTLDLDFEAKNYAQLTEHGVRRLYHVPKGYTGTKDDYAAEHGFKELVEPPMPMTGYWMPEWRETETQLILDWVETEAPIEVTEND